MRPPQVPESRTDDISGILILRHLLSEVIEASRACGLEELTHNLEQALRGVQPQPFQPMRKRKSLSSRLLLRSRRSETRADHGARKRRPFRRAADDE